MRIKTEKVILKHSYQIFEDHDLVKIAINKIPLDLSEIHITNGIAFFEVKTKKDDANLTVILDKNIIQFTFRQELDYSIIQVILDSFPEDFNNTLRLPLLVIDGQIEKEANQEDFNNLLNYEEKSFGLKHLGVDFSTANNNYKITSTIRKNDIKLSFRIPLKENIGNLYKTIDIVKTELYDEVLPSFYKFIRSERKW